MSLYEVSVLNSISPYGVTMGSYFSGILAKPNGLVSNEDYKELMDDKWRDIKNEKMERRVLKEVCRIQESTGKYVDTYV